MDLHINDSKGAQMTQTQPPGFLATPPAGTGPGVLVLHAWWGLNDTMKAFCTQLAEAGFVAFRPGPLSWPGRRHDHRGRSPRRRARCQLPSG
jgi:dienelactone hydrolase